MASDPTPEAAFAELNAWRSLAGIPPVSSLDPVMNEGCRLHNAYLARNAEMDGLSRHDEGSNRPGYTALGEQAGGSSVLSSPAGEGVREAWEHAVYHRMSLLNPRLTTTWFDASSGNACMGVFGVSDVRTAALALYPWPPNGKQDVPLAFAGGEFPSPYDSVPGAKQLGYLLSVNVNGPWEHEHGWVEGSFLQTASLTPDGGAPVAASGIDATSLHGGNLDDGFALFPHRPLAYGKWYTARATGYVSADMGEFDGQNTVMAHLPFDLTWRFRTVQRNPAAHIEIGDNTLKFESDSPAQATATVTRAHTGEEVVRRTAEPGKRWRHRLPAGDYRVCVSQPETETFEPYSNCETWSQMRLSGRLRTGRATVTVTVSPSGKPRNVSLRVNRMECFRPVGGGERRCRLTPVEVYRKTIRVRTARTINVDVDPRVRRVGVYASVSAQKRAGKRFGAAYAYAKLRRK